MSDTQEVYATPIPIPRHLWAQAQANGKLISQVTLDASKFIVSRVGKDLGIALIVATGLAAIFADYESGNLKTREEIDESGLARHNEETLHPGREGMAKYILDAQKALGEEQLQKAAEAIYEARRRITPTFGDGTVVAPFWDASVKPETRLQYLFAASAVLLHERAA